MSAQALVWLKRQSIEDRATMRILDVLAASEQSGSCDVTQEGIAERACLSVRSVRNKLVVLESLGVIFRTRQASWGTRGRAQNVILLNTEKDFNLSREDIRNVSVKANFAGAPKGVFTGNFAGAPTCGQANNIHSKFNDLKNKAPYIYGDVVGCMNLGAKVYLDSSRNQWRALVVIDGAELDLGRHDSKDLAQAEVVISIHEIVHAHAHRTGTPIAPSLIASLKNLSGAELFDFLFGTYPKRSEPYGPRSGSMERVWGIIPQWGAGAKPRYSNVAELSTGGAT